MKKLYFDKKGVSKSYAKGKENDKTCFFAPRKFGEILQIFIILIWINYPLRRE